MGREWYWGGRSSSSSSKRRERGGEDYRESANNSSGCMSAVFHLFDFHPSSHFVLSHQQQKSSLHFNLSTSLVDLPSSEDPPLPKGVEAPRNSLELQEEEEEASFSDFSKEEERLHISMGIQIKTRSTNNHCNLSDTSSPSTKSPNLVARLMGLDLLPSETSSPSFSSSSLSKSHHNFHPPHVAVRARQQRRDTDMMGSSRSLPETPRVSSARRSSVDDYHHRLSLQLLNNKENNNNAVHEELEMSRFSLSSRRKEIIRVVKDENKSPTSSKYARQIVKQVKESVSSRKSGLIDITNTTDHQFKSSSSSPRLRLLEAKHNKPNSTTTSNSSEKSKLQASTIINGDEVQISTKFSVKPPKAKPKSQILQEKQQQQQSSQKISKKVITHERFSRPQRLKKPPQQEEPLVRPSTPTTKAIDIPHQKKTKKIHLPNHILNINDVPSLIPIRKDPQKQISNAQESKSNLQLSSSPSQTYRQQDTQITNKDCKCKSTTNNNGKTAAELEYITRILSRTGLSKDTQLSFTGWFYPSHPLDPSIFHQLQNSTTEPIHQSDRKLLFDLADELLVEIIKPYIKKKPGVVSNSVQNRFNYNGSELIQTLWKKICSFPRANCQVLEDIDSLIEYDLCRLKQYSGMAMAYEEEGEGIVKEIEEEILDTLVTETVNIVRTEAVPLGQRERGGGRGITWGHSRD